MRMCRRAGIRRGRTGPPPRRPVPALGQTGIAGPPADADAAMHRQRSRFRAEFRSRGSRRSTRTAGAFDKGGHDPSSSGVGACGHEPAFLHDGNAVRGLDGGGTMRAITSVVRPSRRRASAVRTRCLGGGPSRADVASSSTRMGAFLRNARGRGARRWRCPAGEVEAVLPPPPTRVPSGRSSRKSVTKAASAAFARIASRGASASPPYAMFAATVSLKRTTSWLTIAIWAAERCERELPQIDAIEPHRPPPAGRRTGGGGSPGSTSPPRTDRRAARVSPGLDDERDVPEGGGGRSSR